MQRKIEKNGFEGIVEYGKRSDCTYGSLKPCPVPAMVYNQPRIEIESNSKSKSILDSCLNQYRNQNQYFNQAWVNTKTKIRNKYLEFNTDT